MSKKRDQKDVDSELPLKKNFHSDDDDDDQNSDIPDVNDYNHGDEEDDDANTLKDKRQHKKFFSSDINKKLLKKKTWECKKRHSKKVGVQLGSAHVDILDTVNIIDTLDRPASTKVEGTYAQKGKYASAFENEPGKRIPKAGVYAAAGVGRARAEFSVLEAEAKGPNASAGAEVSALGAGAMARAEVVSVLAKAGPIGVKLGLALDTGASVGLSGIEAKILGFGFSIGPKTSITLLGSELSFSLL